MLTIIQQNYLNQITVEEQSHQHVRTLCGGQGTMHTAQSLERLGLVEIRYEGDVAWVRLAQLPTYQDAANLLTHLGLQPLECIEYQQRLLAENHPSEAVCKSGEHAYLTLVGDIAEIIICKNPIHYLARQEIKAGQSPSELDAAHKLKEMTGERLTQIANEIDTYLKSCEKGKTSSTDDKVFYHLLCARDDVNAVIAGNSHDRYAAILKEFGKAFKKHQHPRILNAFLGRMNWLGRFAL